ncbi:MULTISPECIES: magnesium chelatase subunit D [unclassified Polynucleobacter]|uniref:magnesium chelatase subunit D n=1 Tax=unclassified Polynucleobacter TaxID=2640945 RepID=UPI0024908B5C|nr:MULTISPECIES: magnesium chelatase subunit D [unclassified Polynucleobacter]
MEQSQLDQTRWLDACLIARMIAVDPSGLGGVWVKSQAGPVRDIWLKGLQQLIQGQVALIKVPSNADEGALIGELDLLKTLALQKKVYSLGILDQVQTGLLLLPMAERMQSHAAALLTQAYDLKSQFGMVAFDESLADEDQHLLPRFVERLAFQINLESLSYRDCHFACEQLDFLEIRKQLHHIEFPMEALEAVMTAAQSLGVDSLRVGLFVARASRVLAALRGSDQLEQRDIQTATRLIFAHRITRLPQSKDSSLEEDSSEENQMPPQNENQPPPPSEDTSSNSDEMQTQDAPQNAPAPLRQEDLEEMIIEASKANLSQNLLDSFDQHKKIIKTNNNSQGKVGQLQKGLLSGQALPSRKGRPSYKHKIDILKTIQAASPWQKIRRLESPNEFTSSQRIIVKADDIHLKQFVQRTTTITVFVVDASGSSAMERLSEAKGAVELLLAQCYIRRDQVALMTFRGKRVELILPPTRSLVRAKRLLAGMPGGGGTPLASAIRDSAQFGKKLKSKGQTPLIILLTDGRANVSIDGIGGREDAFKDALSCANQARLEQLQILFIDTSLKPQETNQQIAHHLGAHYLPLPQGKSASVVQAAKMLMD